MDFNTTLLREKFVIRDDKGEHIAGHPVIAMSNRMVVPLIDRRGKVAETFVVRAQHMHSCIRMAAKIAQSYTRAGPLMIRAEKYNFGEAWENITEDHERKFNPDRWVAVYFDGKLIFSNGTHHPFLDMIEKCEAKNPGNYDDAVKIAEEAFAKSGKHVTIDHEANIGLVVNVKEKEGKCGLILRNPNKKTTFNFSAHSKGEHTVTIAQCLVVAAAYLEGIQLCYLIGNINEKARLAMVAKFSHDDMLADSARRRLGRLNAEIRNFETVLNVRYRPERPEFSAIVIEAERFAREVWAKKSNEE